MNGLQFTDEAARQLEKAYLTRDVIAQRSETIRHLSLSAGERVLDIGCGPGFLCESMGEIVGRKVAVVGIDISADLIARCNGRKTSAHTFPMKLVTQRKLTNQTRPLMSLCVPKLPNTWPMSIVF